MKPNYLVIGAMKCGTTSLCSLLGQHPDIFMSNPKETYFFSNDEVYQRGSSWYESIFLGSENKIAIGEGSTNYSKKYIFPKTIDRIIRYLPELKIIYIVRHPIQQLESSWIHNRINRYDSLSFSKALKKHPTYLDTVNYLQQINVYREYYSDDKILILFFEDFMQNPVNVMQNVFRFLGVDPTFTLTDPKRAENVFTDLYGDRKILFWIRKNPIFNYIINIMPTDFKNMLKPFLKWRKTNRPAWKIEVQKWVIDEIGAESEQFLLQYGKQKDFWDLKFEPVK